jgi:hypothetical protein
VKKLKSGQLDSETCTKLQQLLCESAHAASKEANNSQPMNQVFVGGADAIVQEFLQFFTEREGKAATLVICKLLLGTAQDLGLVGTVSQLVAGLGASKIIGRCGRYFLQTCALIDEDENYHYEDDRPELGKRVQSTGEWVGTRFYLDGQTVEVVAYDGDTATYKYEDGTTEVKPVRGRSARHNFVWTEAKPTSFPVERPSLSKISQYARREEEENKKRMARQTEALRQEEALRENRTERQIEIQHKVVMEEWKAQRQIEIQHKAVMEDQSGPESHLIVLPFQDLDRATDG